MDLGFTMKRMLAGEAATAAPDDEQARLVRELRAVAPFAGPCSGGSFNAAAARVIRADRAACPVTDMKPPFTFVF